MKTSWLLLLLALFSLTLLVASQTPTAEPESQAPSVRRRGRRSNNSDGSNRTRRKWKESLTQDEVERIRSAQRTWEAEIPPNFADMTIEQLQSLLSVFPPTASVAPSGKDGFLSTVDDDSSTPPANTDPVAPTFVDDNSPADPAVPDGKDEFLSGMVDDNSSPPANQDTPADSQPADPQPADSQPADPQSTDSQPTDQTPAEDSPTQDQPAPDTSDNGSATNPDVAPVFDGETDTNEAPEHTADDSTPAPLPALAPIPDYFDARDKWGSCIGPVRNQKNCGSCWALGTSITLEDRLCIAGSKVFKQMSPQFLIDCDSAQNGCDGGNPLKAWDFLKKVGIPSEACYPYKAAVKTCPTTCVDGKPLDLVRLKSTRSYTSIEDVKRDIMEYGPVNTWMTIYEDFFYYKAGVYQRTSDVVEGFHAAKVIGWGTDAYYGDYWIAENIWTTLWGEAGFFRIKAKDGDFDNLSHFIGGYVDV